MSQTFRKNFDRIDWRSVERESAEAETLAKSPVQVKLTDGKRDRNYEYLTESPPFFVNKRGRLTHRPRIVFKIFHPYKEGPDKFSHYHVTYECGGGCNFDTLEDLTADPPKSRLVCALCEQKAAERGEKSSDELVGRHVHKGRMVPVRTCCQHETEKN